MLLGKSAAAHGGIQIKSTRCDMTRPRRLPSRPNDAWQWSISAKLSLPNRTGGHIDLRRDEDYPDIAPIAVKIRSLEADLRWVVFARGGFAHSGCEVVAQAAHFLRSCALLPSIERKKTRALNRNCTVWDLRRAGAAATSLNLFRISHGPTTPTAHPTIAQTQKRGEK